MKILARLSLLGLLAVACAAGQDTEDDLAPVRDVSKLRGAAQLDALRNLLVHPPDSILYAAFTYDDQLREPLKLLVNDLDAGQMAKVLLIWLGDSAELEAAVRSLLDANPSGDHETASSLASFLIVPRTEDDWAFLRRATFGEYRDRSAQINAIQTLQLIASSRSLAILRSAQRNAEGSEQIARAIEYIESNPPPLTSSDPNRLAKRVAGALRAGDWQGNSPAVYNQRRDRALVAMTFLAGRDRYTYYTVLRKSGPAWRLAAVLLVAQALLPLASPVTH